MERIVNELLYFALTGLGAGAIYAMLAVGLVVTQTGSRVINFAQGAVATYAAYAYVGLTDTGSLPLPLVDFLPGDLNVPTSIAVANSGLTPGSAAAIAISAGTVLTLISYLLVFRPLRSAAPLAKVVGAVGVLLYVQSVIVFQNSGLSPSVKSLLPGNAIVNILGTGRSLPSDRIWLTAIAIVVSAALWMFFRFSHAGLAIRAVAENPRGAAYLGYSEQRIASICWVAAGFVTSLVGVLAVPLTGLRPNQFTVLLVPALAVALLARFSSIPVAAIGGLGVGVLESLANRVSQYDWFPGGFEKGLTQVVPLLLVLGVLLTRSRVIMERGALIERALPRAPLPRNVGAKTLALAAVGVFIAWTSTGTWSVALTTSAIGLVLMLSLVVLIGYVGQVSLAQLSISGIGAFAVMRLMSNGTTSTVGAVAISGPGFPFLVAAALAVLISTSLGVAIGLPALRIRGVQLAIATMTLAFAIEELVLNSKFFVGEGASRSSVVPKPTVFGANVSSIDPHTGVNDRFVFSVIAVVTAALFVFLVANLRTGRYGRKFLAIRANENAAAASGVDVVRTKIYALTFASFLAGCAGVLTAMQRGTLDTSQFSFFVGLSLIVFVYIGGITSVWGAVVGCLLLGGGLVDEFFRSNFDTWPLYSPILGGFLLAVNAVSYPAGIVVGLQDIVGRFAHKSGASTAARRGAAEVAVAKSGLEAT
jgi:branched-chain amino acid transport system permease protein